MVIVAVVVVDVVFTVAVDIIDKNVEQSENGFLKK